jgi:TonB family protein
MFANDMKKSFLWSALLHAMVILAFVKFYDSFLVVRTPLLMELTLIGQMSRGDGLGARESQTGQISGIPEVGDSSKGEFDSPSRKAEPAPRTESIAGEVSIAQTPVDSQETGAADRDRYLESVRKSSPIGIAPKREASRHIKTTAGLGHMGVAGSPTGNANIEGQLSARGIRHQVFPLYPDWAKKQGIEGMVKYRLTVLPNGMLRSDIQMDQTSGYREMDKSVFDALIQWEFDPLPPEASQVDQSGVITFIFNFKQGLTVQ